MTPPQKRDLLLGRAYSVLQVHEAAGTVPTVYQSRVKKPWQGRTSNAALSREYGNPVSYVYVSEPREPRSLLTGPNAIIFQAHDFTLRYYLAWKDDDTFSMSSQADYEKAIYSDDAAEPGLMYDLENNRILADQGNGDAIMDRIYVSPRSDSIIYLLNNGELPVHMFESVVTVSADVTQP